MKITQATFDELNAELKILETTTRTEIAKNIEIARGFGDLSENAEYKAAREAQAENERRIEDIKQKLKDVEIINLDEVDINKVGIGTIVTVKDDSKKEKKYAIVSTLETNVLANDGIKAISDQSPIGKAICNLKVGEVGIAKTPVGDKKFTIVQIERAK